MTVAIVVLFVTQLLVPLLLITGLLRGKFLSKASWLAAVLGTGAFVAYFLLVGRWDWVSYYLRVAMLVALLCAVYVSFRRTFGKERVPWWRSPGSVRGWLSLLTNALLAVLFAAFTIIAARGLGPGDLRAAQLSFPLEGGVFYVAHGGGSPPLNYHNVDRAQRFALDAVKLNPAGTRAFGLYPSEPSRYAVFGERVHAPCAGEVIEAVDGRPDLNPPEADRKNLAGNHVVLRCAEEGVDVALAHMREGSVAVEQGERVEEGQLLGRVGNSGNTSEPHLHVHAVRTGSGTMLKGGGVAILFDGRFLVRKSLVF